MKRSPLKRSSVPMRRTSMRRGKPLNPIGKKGRANLDALAQQTAAFKEAGIYDRCEARWPHECFGRLEFAHYRKRSHVLSDEELLYGVARICSTEHLKLDTSPAEVMAAKILRTILERRKPGAFFSLARIYAADWWQRHVETTPYIRGPWGSD